MIILKRNFSSQGIIIENGEDDPTELATMDLVVGDRYQLADRAEWRQFAGRYILEPNHYILVRTRERVTLPADVLGVLCSKGSLSAQGLIISNTKVDPVSGDHLNIPVFNAGETPIEISVGMKFCSIYFQELHQAIPPLSYKKSFAQLNIEKHPIRDFFLMHSEAVVASIFSAIIAALITAGFESRTHYFMSVATPPLGPAKVTNAGPPNDPPPTERQLNPQQPVSLTNGSAGPITSQNTNL